MFAILRQPFPFTVQKTDRIRTALIYGLFVFLFLLVFKPFGLNYLGASKVLRTTFYYGAVCSAVLTVCFLLVPAMIPSLYDERRWTVWKEILHTVFCVLCVTVANAAFTHFYLEETFGLALLWKFCWITFSVSVLPVTFLVLIRQIRLMRTFSREAAELDREVISAKVAAGAEDAIVMVGQETFPLSISQFLYAEAADNYTKLFYRDGPVVASKVIRSSLKKLEEDLNGQPVYRCHRGYIIHVNKIVHISGNAQGYKLYLEGVNQAIPVSRSQNKEIAALVSRPKHPSIGPSDL